MQNGAFPPTTESLLTIRARKKKTCCCQQRSTGQLTCRSGGPSSSLSRNGLSLPICNTRTVRALGANHARTRYGFSFPGCTGRFLLSFPSSLFLFCLKSQDVDINYDPASRSLPSPFSAPVRTPGVFCTLFDEEHVAL